MADIDLNFIARQIQRALSKIDILQGNVTIIRRQQTRTTDDISAIKSDMQGMRADITTLRSDFLAMRSEMRDSIDALEARLKPLEDGDGDGN